MTRTIHLRVRTIATFCSVALLLFASAPARADKVYYKNGKVIEGIVEKEYDQRIEFQFQGRTMVIPRERIDRIERGEAMENLDLLISKIDEALGQENADRAQALLNQANELAPPESYRARLGELQLAIEKLRALGTAAQRRERAEGLLAQAIEKFDRIETKDGIELLFKALESDPAFDAAHDQMAKFMKQRESVPDIGLAADYFHRLVDPAKVKFDHPVIKLLPQVFVEEVRDLQRAEEPEAIDLHIQRLKKLTAAFEAHSDWAAKAVGDQRTLVDLGALGVVGAELDRLFEAGEYPKAEIYLKALGTPADNPRIAEFYTRSYIGNGRLDEAIALYRERKEGSSDPARIDELINILELYSQVGEAAEKGERREARALLQRIFDQRDRYSDVPEIYRLVAGAKADYDLSAMEGLESAEEHAQAADLAVQVAGYSVDPKIRKRAEEAFARLSPKLPYKLNAVWKLDGLELPISPRGKAAVQQRLTEKFAFAFDDSSPFELNVEIRTDTEGGAAKSAGGQSEAAQLLVSGIRFNVAGLTIATSVKHTATGRELYRREDVSSALPAEVAAAREVQGNNDHKNGRVIYAGIGSVEEFDVFLESDFQFYLSPELALIGSQMVAAPQP